MGLLRRRRQAHPGTAQLPGLRGLVQSQRVGLRPAFGRRLARGDGTQPTKLTRGIPVQEHFTWNRAITLPGCVTLASSARPGSYQAQARTSAISSGTFSFKLVR